MRNSSHSSQKRLFTSLPLLGFALLVSSVVSLWDKSSTTLSRRWKCNGITIADGEGRMRRKIGTLFHDPFSRSFARLFVFDWLNSSTSPKQILDVIASLFYCRLYCTELLIRNSASKRLHLFFSFPQSFLCLFLFSSRVKFVIIQSEEGYDNHESRGV
jgi:hypothetical protein